MMTEKTGSVLKIALLQMASHGTDQEANASKAESFCRGAAALGADVALMPEIWNIGYTFYDEENPDIPDTVEEWAAHAVGPESDYVRRFRALARELEMAIGLTYLEAWDGPPRNTISLIDRHGEIVLTYAKVHTCDFSRERACTPGDDFYVAELDTASGPVKVGAMICFDREQPESARILMLKGAEIILTPNACTLDVNRLTQYRSRAFENKVGLAMANYAAPQHNGHSVAFDGIDGRDHDMLLVQAGENEGIFPATFDLKALREYRERAIWGNHYRRPSRYNILASMDVERPFVRDEERR